MRLLISLLFIVSLGLTPAAKAETASVVIGTTDVELRVPDGWCLLSRDNPNDIRIIKGASKAVAGVNRLLAAFAECKELREWRAGKRPTLSNHGQYQTSRANETKVLRYTREQVAQAVCANYSKQSFNTDAISAWTKERIEKAMKGVTVDKQQFLGAVTKPTDACYAGVFQKFKTQTGSTKNQTGVFATTFTRGKIIYVYMYAPKKGPAEFKDLIKRTQGLVADFYSANGDNN